MKPIMKQFNTTAIIELYNTVDLIGISSYAGKTHRDRDTHVVSHWWCFWLSHAARSMLRCQHWAQPVMIADPGNTLCPVLQLSRLTST